MIIGTSNTIVKRYKCVTEGQEQYTTRFWNIPLPLYANVKPKTKPRNETQKCKYFCKPSNSD